jgi:hypothetical protein
METDAFGLAILSKGIFLATLKEWSLDPQVELSGGGKGSVFDALEDMDHDECLEALENLHKARVMHSRIPSM